MRILHLVPIIAEAATYGGPARGTMRQAVESVARGHEVTVMALSPDVGTLTRSESSGVRLVLAPMFKLPGHRIAGAMSFSGLRWVRRNAGNFDVVHVHAGREIFTTLAMIALRRAGIPYILQTHGMLAPRSSVGHRAYDLALTRRAVAGAARVLSLTNYEDRDLQAFFAKERVVRLVNGVDDPLDEPAPPCNEVPEIVFLSRLHPRKRPQDLLDAVAAINRDEIRTRLTYFGPDEGALGDLLERVGQLGATDYVTYGGAIPYSEVRKRLSSFDIFVLPSVNEPFPNSVLEAMASGMAVICTSSCGLAPYIREASAGIVVDPGADNVERAISEVLAQPELLKSLGASALDLTKRQFSMSAVVESLASVYQDVVAEAGVVPRDSREDNVSSTEESFRK